TAKKLQTDGWLFGWRTGSNYQPNAAVWADAGARRFCKDKGRKAATAKQELRKITAARALIRRISGIKSSEISKERCEATCQVKPKTTKNQYYVRLHFSRSRARRNRSPRLSPLHVLDWACLDHKQQSHQPTTTTTTTTTQPQS